MCTVTEDQTLTVSGAHSPRFVLFVFESFLFVPVCFCFARHGSRRSSCRPSLLQVGVGVRRDRRESAGRESLKSAAVRGSLKGIVHPKMKILSSFTHPQVVPNLYECLCSAEHKGRYSEECGKQSSSGAPLTSIVFFFPSMEVNGVPKQPGYKLSSKYLPLCLAEQRNSYRFGTTLG